MSQKEELVNNPKAKKQRLLSIDALRGFDMFWILGGEKLFAAFFIITGWDNNANRGRSDKAHRAGSIEQREKIDFQAISVFFSTGIASD